MWLWWQVYLVFSPILESGREGNQGRTMLGVGNTSGAFKSLGRESLWERQRLHCQVGRRVEERPVLLVRKPDLEAYSETSL